MKNKSSNEILFKTKKISNYVEFSLPKFCIISALLLQSCAPVNYKIPEREEDYAYYGSDYRNAVEAIKYCRANKSSMEDMRINVDRVKLTTTYEKLRNLAKNNDNSGKEYPIPSKQSLGNQAMYYGVYLPLAVITSPIWIWSYLDKYEYKPSEPKTIKEHIDLCDRTYLLPLINGKISEANNLLQLCEDDMRHYENSKDSGEETGYRDSWWDWHGRDAFSKIDKDSPISYLLTNYHKAELRYSTDLQKFNLDQVESCSKFYKDLDSREMSLRGKDKIANSKNKALAVKYGYKDLYTSGLLYMDSDILTGEKTLEDARQFLVRTGGAFDATLVVESVIDNLVVYRSTFNKKLKIVLQKEAGKFYGTGAKLSGTYFAIAGTATIKMNRGSFEAVVFKRIQ